MKQTADERFDAKWEVVPWSGCYIWLGNCNASGHGRFYLNGKLVYAHRFSFERAFGPLRPGMQACHRCDMPWCVNPAHLFEGTQADNMADCHAKDRGAWGFRFSHTKLPLSVVDSILTDARPQIEIAVEHGISQSYVSTLKHASFVRKGASNANPVLIKRSTKLSDDAIRRIRLDMRRQVDIARDFGVDQSTISLIKNFKIRRDLSCPI